MRTIKDASGNSLRTTFINDEESAGVYIEADDKRRVIPVILSIDQAKAFAANLAKAIATAENPWGAWITLDLNDELVPDTWEKRIAADEAGSALERIVAGFPHR